MAKRIGQVRFYKDRSPQNYPQPWSKDSIRYGEPFSGKRIIQLGIQTLPGTKFSINNNPAWLVVGMTGIYELNVDGLTAITGIVFDPNSISMISANDNAYLIVDYLYEDGES